MLRNLPLLPNWNVQIVSKTEVLTFSSHHVLSLAGSVPKCEVSSGWKCQFLSASLLQVRFAWVNTRDPGEYQKTPCFPLGLGGMQTALACHSSSAAPGDAVPSLRKSPTPLPPGCKHRSWCSVACQGGNLCYKGAAAKISLNLCIPPEAAAARWPCWKAVAHLSARFFCLCCSQISICLSEVAFNLWKNRVGCESWGPVMNSC